jgi:hypothetical protein
MKSTLAVISLAALVTILYILLFEVSVKAAPKTNSTEFLVVERISLSVYQSFNVSGKGFSFHTKELTFNVNDTIVIKGDLVYPKNNPTLTVKKTWH